MFSPYKNNSEILAVAGGPKSRRSGRLAQDGVATILMVVLVGMGVTAMALGIMHSVRSTQEKQVASHAIIHAQNSLWGGVEAFRRYLLLDTTDLGSIADNSSYSIAMGAEYGTITAENIIVTTVDGNQRISANIISHHHAAKASAAVGVVIEVEQAGGSANVTLPAALNFYDDLAVNGAINFTGLDPSQKLDINVDGLVDFQNLNLNSIGTLASTQSISLVSGITDIDRVHSNGNVTFANSPSTIGSINARGNVTLSGNATATNVKANGFINSSTSGYSANLNALGDITVSGGANGLASAGGAITWTGGTFSGINAVGNISINTAYESPAGVVNGEGNITCITGKSYGTIKVNGSATNCSGAPQTGAGVTVPLMSPVTEVTMAPFIVDVYELQGHANWIFSYDTVGNRMMVRVQNINGVADGSYVVRSFNGNLPDNTNLNVKGALCAPLAGAAATDPCMNFVTPTVYVCMGNYNGECISYNTGTQKWKLDGASAAPGIMWFEGNVNMNNGTNHTTILASGNIDSGGQFKGYAVNYAGYAKVCQANASHLSDASERTNYTTKFSGRYPTNLCDTANNALLPVSAGNIALAAGGYPPPSTTYVGGNIALAGSNEVYGSVLAGNAFQTDYGNTNIFGYVVAANMSESDTLSNLLNGSTQVNLSSFPATYNPTEVPGMGGAGGGGGGAETTTAKVLWSKYL